MKRGLGKTAIPRTVKVAGDIYTYEDFHAGDEKFTTTNLFVVTEDGVVVADGQSSPAQTKGLVDAIAKITSKPIKYVVICSDHGDHTAGNSSFPVGVTYVIHPTSKAILEGSQNHRALDAVVKEVQRLHDAHVPVEEALKRADFGEYSRWTLSGSQGPIAIRRVYDELDGKLK
jgi:glyoxylase-like metal-dependent hydrolase (beta-lactamase superfamily II)